MVTAAAAPGRLEEILQFEEHEQERFLSTHYSLEEVRAVFFEEITPELYQSLYQKTKKGLQKGVTQFLDWRQPRPQTIYQGDLYEFSFDDSTEQAIREELQNTVLGTHHYLDDYCKDVGGGYRMYILNESSRRFRQEFETSKKAQYG